MFVAELNNSKVTAKTMHASQLLLNTSKYGDAVCCFPRSLVTWLGVAYKYKPFQLELNSNFIPERSFRAEFLFSFVGMRLNCANCLEEE